MQVDFNDLIDRAHKATEENGIAVRGGKKYSQVATRIELFRRAYGDAASIETEIVHLGMVKGEPVVIRAKIILDGRTVATGTASEVIGQGNVNSNSALENAETSAIGRALATLGLHGGEMASLNEMERVEEKPKNFAAAGLADAWGDAACQHLPDEPTQEQVAEAFADQIIADVKRYKSADGLDSYMRRQRGNLAFVESHGSDHYTRIREAVTEHRKSLSKVAA